MKWILKHVRGHAVAYVALFFALSAGAYAATKAPKNSVVTKSIANKAVKTKKLGGGAVTEAKLANGAVSEAKLKPFVYTDVTAFTNGWGPLTASELVSYGKDAAGFVHLRGRIRGTTLATSAFTLPDGFRPATSESFGAGGIGGGNSLPCVVGISTGGTVTPGVTGGDTGCLAAGATILSGIVFKAGG